MVKFLEKTKIHRIPGLMWFFLFCHSIYGTDEPSFFDGFFGSPSKPPQKVSSSIPHNPQAFHLQSPSLQPSCLTQVKIPEEMSPIAQKARAFLQAFPKILNEMANLEKHIPTLIPEHRRNPKNLCNCPRGGDWRVFLMAAVGKEDPNPDPDISERIQKIGEDFEALKKKKALEKAKSLKSKTQDTTSLREPNGALEKQTEEEYSREMASIPEMLRLWFYNTCNPTPQSLRNFLQDYSYFNQWWAGLYPQLRASEDVQLLHLLLKQGNCSTKVLDLLDDLLVQSLLLKSQSLYEELLPTFMDLKTSSRTLQNLKEEALREDDKLDEILHKSDLYKKIESLIAETIESAVMPLMEDCLQQITGDNLKQNIREAFQQGIKNALTEGSNSLREKNQKESEDSVAIEENNTKILQENLQKVIVNAIRETINGGLNQATGRIKIDKPLQSSSSRGGSSKKTTETSINRPVSLDDQTLIVDIAPIIQSLSEFIKPPEQTTSRWYWTWSSSTKSPISTNLIPIPIPPEIQQQWKIPSYRPIPRSKPRSTKGALGKSSKSSSQQFSKIESAPISFEESQKEYLKNPFPESDIIPIRTGLLKEIRALRQYRNHIVHAQPQSFQEFIAQKKSVHFLFDFPTAYAYVPGIGSAQLFPKILRFFEEYESLITSYRKNFQKTEKSDLGFYLNPKRPSVNLCRSHKGPFFNAFPLLDPTELKTGWISLEVMDLFDRRFLNDEDRGSFRAELEENLFLLPMVDGFPDQSLNIATLDISRLIGNAKKVLFFKEKCDALMAERPLPLEKDNQQLILALFKEKCQAVSGVPEAIERMLEREKAKNEKKLSEDENFTEDRCLLISFFTELFQEILTKYLFEFGLTPEKLETLKKIASPLPPKLEGDQDSSSSPIQLTNAGRTSQLPLDSQEDSKVTFHVPIDFSPNSQVLPEEVAPSNRSAQPQGEDDLDLPPVQKLNLSGEIGKSLF